jgi:hypothetical protein
LQVAFYIAQGQSAIKETLAKEKTYELLISQEAIVLFQGKYEIGSLLVG